MGTVIGTVVGTTVGCAVGEYVTGALVGLAVDLLFAVGAKVVGAWVPQGLDIDWVCTVLSLLSPTPHLSGMSLQSRALRHFEMEIGGSSSRGCPGSHVTSTLVRSIKVEITYKLGKISSGTTGIQIRGCLDHATVTQDVLTY